MIIIRFVSFAVLFIYIAVGLNAFLQDRKSKLIRTFSLMCLFLAISTCSGTIIYLSKNPLVLKVCLIIEMCGAILSLPSILLFCIYLTKTCNINIRHILIIYFPSLIFLVVNAAGYSVFFEEVMIENGNYVFIISSHKTAYIAYLIYFHVNFILYLILVMSWGIKSKITREKKQALFFSLAFIVSITVSAIESIILPNFTNYKSNGISLHIFALFIVGLWYGIIKYRLFPLTPELVQKDILREIEESVIVLDRNLQVSFINRKTENLLKTESADLKGKGLSAILNNGDKINSEMKKMLEGKLHSFSCRNNFILDGSHLMDLKFTVLRDRYRDPLGILIMGTEVKEVKFLKRLFNITDREAQIIEYLITGISNADITKELDITENTIKKHITNIYNKLSVTNRVELLNCLKEYDLLPEKISDKTLLCFE